ncbi:TonB-dependent copper receptor [Halovibrio salipaludis]|uniref:TonB-dependent copper receptor n=2 Tax=Halovibrio salipaludis TaxID=2032626 RepID=A0A2A2FD10_9GAMM|nr:TonB-dependent copper receptor [Halovibrio salipaludis]
MALEPVVVTTSRMDTPYEVTSDPKQPHASLPAQDGGAYLESVTGFNVSRKGGTSGEPVLRGLGGSRLNISASGGAIPGGCPSRMDPPTAYIFPQSYDRIEITKGPQSVRHGPATAGSVRFERDAPDFSQTTTRGFASFTAGSHARNDMATDITTGDADGYARFIGTLSSQDDYEDGGGETVHSQHERWSTSAIAGWTPGSDTEVEFSYDRSNAEAAYDDRSMDGTDFDRTGYRLSGSHENLASWLPRVEATAYYNNVDHVMDNFRLRDPGNMAMTRIVKRTTLGGRLAADMAPLPGMDIHAGLDYATNEHADSGSLMTMGSPLGGARFRSAPTPETAEFSDTGIFADMEQRIGDASWLTLGLRGDYHEAEALETGFGEAVRGQSDHRTQWSGFGRYEVALHDLPLNLYTGLGRSERAPDFWERERDFGIGSETLTQVDAGITIDHPRIQGTVALFHGWYDDYILITGGGDSARNVDAVTRGLEADVTVTLTPELSLTSSLAWTRSTNDTGNEPLAQTPPLEGTLGLDYEQAGYSAGVQWRGVARQDRVDEGSGTIYSLDTRETPGFATVSLHGGMQLFRETRLSAGIDNVFDQEYAEHIQKGSADLGAGSEPINEPGRILWASITTEF